MATSWSAEGGVESSTFLFRNPLHRPRRPIGDIPRGAIRASPLKELPVVRWPTARDAAPPAPARGACTQSPCQPRATFAAVRGVYPPHPGGIERHSAGVAAEGLMIAPSGHRLPRSTASDPCG